MAGPIPDMLIQVRLETAQLKSDMAALEGKFKNLGTQVNNANVPFANLGRTLRNGLGMLGLAVGVQQVTQAFGGAIKAASDLNEVSTAVDQVFGSASAQLKEYAKTTSDTMGQSQRQFLDAAKTFGIFGKAAGLANADNATFSTGLTKLAADLASFNNTSVDEAITALGAGLRGESEPLRRFGVLLDDAALKAQAMKMKIYDGSGALTQQQRVLAAHAAILEQTKTQQGDFARTADGLANSQRTLTAVMEDASAQIGDSLAPIMAEFIQGLIPLVKEYVPKLTENMKKIPWKSMADGAFKFLEFILKNGEAIKNFAIQVGAAVTAWKLYRVAAGFAETAQLALNGAMAASPVGLLAVGIATLVAWLVTAKGAYDEAATSAGKLARAQSDKAYAKKLADKSGITGIASNFWGNQTGATREAGMAAADAAAAKRAADAAKAAKLAGDNLNLPDLLGGNGSGSGTAKETTAQKNKRVALAYLDSVNTKVAAATKKFDEATESAYADHADKLKTLYQRNADDLAALEKDNAEKTLAIQVSYAQKLKDIVQQSIDSLRNAFRSATATDVGTMFKDLAANGQASADGLIAALKTRLDSIKVLAENAAKLSGLGFSQTFIEQVVAQGPQAGSEMAQALLDATPESQKQLQELFSQTETLSGHGMDELSKTIYAKSGLATDALKTLYSDTQTELATALAEQQKTYDEKLAEINKALTDGLADANDALNDSLTKAANALNDTLDTLDAAMTKKLASLKGKLGDVQKQIADARNGLNSSYVDATMAGSNGPGESAATQFGADTPWAKASASVQERGAAIVVNNYNQTDASPALIADTTVAAIKYGTPISKLA